MARYKDYDYCQTKMIPLSFDRQPRIPPRYGQYPIQLLRKHGAVSYAGQRFEVTYELSDRTIPLMVGPLLSPCRRSRTGSKQHTQEAYRDLRLRRGATGAPFTMAGNVEPVPGDDSPGLFHVLI